MLAGAIDIEPTMKEKKRGKKTTKKSRKPFHIGQPNNQPVLNR
jgi:hypothetical protein